MTPICVPSPRYLWRLHRRLRDRLPMWVVYRPFTSEYPGLWVARMHVTIPEQKPTRFVITHVNLRDLRRVLPPGLACLDRAHDDAPEIEEVWA